MKYVTASALVLFGLAACSGPGAVTPRGALMYQVPSPPSVKYLTEGSQDVMVDAGAMGSITSTSSSETILAMDFVTGPDGVEVTTRFEKVSASVDQPMGGTISASEADVEGDLIFTLDGRGRGTVVSVPEVTGSAEQLITPASLVHEFFPRLPGRMVNPGEMWTDTIRYELSTGQGDISSNSVVSYTLVGDTAVGGSTLLHVTYEGSVEWVAALVNQGMEVIQTASGETGGMFLWDPNRNLVVAGESTAELEGTVEIIGAGMPPMPLTVTAKGSTRLQES